MKSKKGITLTALVIYVIVMLIAIGIMSSIVNQFQNNMNRLDKDTDDIVKFNNFNTYFLKEIKQNGNSIDTIEENYILFKSGNSFSFNNNQIYYNNIKICDGVNEISFSLPDENDKTVINVNIRFENYSKSINYKIEEIY